MELKDKLTLPLEDKLLLTKLRIQQWYERYDGKIYVAFSGGKDSTVLLQFHKLRRTHPKIYNYAINKMGLKEPLDFLGINYGEENEINTKHRNY